MTQADERRRILEMVASGTISSAEAADLLEALSQGEEEGPATFDEEIERVRVIGTFRSLRIEGDPSVKGAVAHGAHIARRENGTLVFEEDPEEENVGFMLFGPREARREFRTPSGRRVKIDADFGGGRRFRIDREFPFHRPPVLRIRMNPELALEVDITAGPVRVSGIKGPIKAEVAAGSGHFEDIRAPIDIACDAGSVVVEGVFDRGDSRVRCTAGKVRLRIERGSDVQVIARSTLGKISVPEGDWGGIGGGRKEFTVGDGKATLDVEATTGLVSIEVEK